MGAHLCPSILFSFCPSCHEFGLFTMCTCDFISRSSDRAGQCALIRVLRSSCVLSHTKSLSYIFSTLFSLLSSLSQWKRRKKKRVEKLEQEREERARRKEKICCPIGSGRRGESEMGEKSPSPLPYERAGTHQRGEEMRREILVLPSFT